MLLLSIVRDMINLDSLESRCLRPEITITGLQFDAFHAKTVIMFNVVTE